jgi:hypothetical protein
MATSLSLENDSSLAQGYLKVNGTTAATLTTSGITGNLVGNVTGDVTGNVTGNVTGSLTAGGSLTLATAQTASGTAVDFTGIPSWAKRITVMFSNVSTSGSSPITVQLGDSGGIETTGYTGGSCNQISSYLANTVGFNIHPAMTSSQAVSGISTLCLISSLSWVFSAGTQLNSANVATAGGAKSLSDILTQIRITTVNGTDTFDAGTINISYEG